MCLIVVAHRAHPRYALVVAANRDEFHQRPTAAADFWPGSEILGGRDLQSGGTWLGVTRSGRFAAVTNFHEPGEKRSDDLSRGMLVRGFLESRATPRQFLEGIDGNRYAGFGLFVSDLASLGYLSNRHGEPRILPPGIYALSNHLLDTDWGKVRRGKAAMSKHLGEENLSSALLETLSEREDGASRENAIFVLDPVHGTRSSTVVTVDSSGALTFVERGFDSAGRETYTKPFGFRGVSAASTITPAV